MGNQVEVLSREGQTQGTVELSEELFGAEVSEYAIYRAVVTYEANQRQGTASVKTRSEVRRSGKKHHRQKGTGWARRGSMRSPLVRGGGVAFGPKPRSYRSRMNKNLKALALRSALTLKSRSGAIGVVEDFDFEAPTTKGFRKVIDACGMSADRILFVTAEANQVLYKSCRNLPNIKMTTVGTLGTYDVVAAERLVFTRSAPEGLSQRVADGGSDARSTDE